ncbi:MAG: VWA domain-containing protein [Spirosomataceae bacterium]
MELDELLYGKVLSFFKKIRKNKEEANPNLVRLEMISPKLTIIARAITGKAIEIFPAEREGGYRNTNFFLPQKIAFFDTFESNLSFYFFRVLYLSIQQKLGLNWSSNHNEELQESREKAVTTSAIVLEKMFEEFELTQALHQSFLGHFNSAEEPDLSWLYGKWMRNDPETETEKKLENFGIETKIAEEKQILTTLKTRAIEEVISVEIDKKQQEDYVLTHNFEKVETAEEFDGTWRDFDGDDELEKHQEALEELKMKYTVRVDDMAHSVYQADFIENTTVSESAETDQSGYHLLYDEWDFSTRRYKTDFCKVYPFTQLKTDKEYYHQTLKNKGTVLTGLRKMLANVNNKMMQHRRQNQGDEFDIDATTDMLVDIFSKKTPSENIYLANRKKEKDISILLLLDVSLSSDSYAAGNRVIDIEKQVSILFGEILNEFNIDFSIDCFYSKTRNYTTYISLKDFDESWDASKNRIGAAEPQGYTRIGAALRHSGQLLKKRKTKNKWIILISDGKPNDYDKYEGKYGINDVKQALRELHEQQINSYALAIEAQAKYYLPQMFGQNHYQILTTPEELLESLILLFEKIKYKS